MEENKRYYWIKLKTDFFNEDAIDFLLSQPNGCEYIVLYQMLCTKAANTKGLLQSCIGEMIIPYDINKIARDTKYFNQDTIRVALELYKALGLIYVADNETLAIANYEDMVGSETNSAKKVREWRKKRDQKRLHCNPQSNNNVRQEIEYRDKSIEIDKDINNIVSHSDEITIEQKQSQSGVKYKKDTPPVYDDSKNRKYDVNDDDILEIIQEEL